MKRVTSRYLVLIVLSLFIAAFGPGSSFAYDLFADTLMIDGGEKQEGTIYVKGEKYRIQRQREAEYIILRHDLGVMWVVIPAGKTYVELPLDSAKTPKIKERNTGEVDRKYVGAEITDGHPASKYEITVREGPKTESFYQWTATDLDFPVKTAALDGSWIVEFKNIRTGVSETVFEIPEGYEKATGTSGEGRTSPPEGEPHRAPAPKRMSAGSQCPFVRVDRGKWAGPVGGKGRGDTLYLNAPIAFSIAAWAFL
jgi:hypothetical protein